MTEEENSHQLLLFLLDVVGGDVEHQQHNEGGSRGRLLQLGVGAGGALLQLHVEGLVGQLFQHDIRGGWGFFQLLVQGDCQLLLLVGARCRGQLCQEGGHHLDLLAVHLLHWLQSCVLVVGGELDLPCHDGDDGGQQGRGQYQQVRGGFLHVHAPLHRHIPSLAWL